MELTKCKLGELITQRREKNDGSDLPICGVSKDGLIPPKQIDADTSIYNVFYRDDFIFNPARMELNSIAINDRYDRAICSSLYEVFFVHRTDLLLPHYLKLIVKQPWFTRYCEFLGQGSAREYCRFNNISEIEVEFPSIVEQQKVIDSYASIQKRIEIKKQINDNLVETANTLFSKFFVANEEKKTWNEGSFSQLLLETVGGDWGQETPSGNYTCEVSCIRGTDIPALNLGSISDAPTRYILEKNFNTKRICANDMVVEISGGSPVQATGRIALVPERILSYRGSNIICSNFCRVMKVDADYLYFFLQNWLYLYRNGVMFNYENSSTGLKNFNFAAFTEEHKILIPPKELSVKFNALIEPIYKEIANIGFEIEHLNSLLGYILPRMMSVGF